MTGIVSQIIALITYGNNFLHNGIIPGDFDHSNSTFKFCNKIEFTETVKKKKTFSSPKSKEYYVANFPTMWFKYLKATGCNKLRLHYESSANFSMTNDYKLAGMVGGGGTWLIETIYDNYSGYWVSQWEVTNQNAADKKIWAVKYNGFSEQLHPSLREDIDIDITKNQLESTLVEISDFARKQDLISWSEWFDKAKVVLHNDTPEESYYHEDLVPIDSFSQCAKQLLFAAGAAWVFGGMGSWNDLWFEKKEDNDTYERLSAQLYSSINNAVIASVNFCEHLPNEKKNTPTSTEDYEAYFDSICHNIFKNDKSKIMAEFPEIKHLDVWKGIFIALTDEAFISWTIPQLKAIKKACLRHAKKYDSRLIVKEGNFRVSFDSISNYTKYGSSHNYWKSDLIANQITI